MKYWFHQIRGTFLILSVVLVLIGIGAAHHQGFHNWGHSVLLIIGVMLAHISVNLFNELSDYHTKIDESTVRTPFSGGSGLLQEGKTSTGNVKIVAYATLLASGVMGCYFIVHSGWPVFTFMVLGGLAVRFYTSHLAKWILGELAAGLTLGAFVVLGSYYVLAKSLPVEIVIVSIPPGILTALLLLLNEFPDAEADRGGGRHHLVIHFGKAKCAKIYVSGLAVVYLIILGASFMTHIPFTILLAIATLPLAVKATTNVLRYYDDMSKLIPTLGMNVGIVILTDFFLAVGFFL